MFSYIKYEESVQYKPKNNEDSNIIPPFNAFSKNAKVSGKAVYVNYGRVEDFEELVVRRALCVLREEERSIAGNCAEAQHCPR